MPAGVPKRAKRILVLRRSKLKFPMLQCRCRPFGPRPWAPAAPAPGPLAPAPRHPGACPAAPTAEAPGLAPAPGPLAAIQTCAQ